MGKDGHHTSGVVDNQSIVQKNLPQHRVITPVLTVSTHTFWRTGIPQLRFHILPLFGQSMFKCSNLIAP